MPGLPKQGSFNIKFKNDSRPYFVPLNSTHSLFKRIKHSTGSSLIVFIVARITSWSLFQVEK